MSIHIIIDGYNLIRQSTTLSTLDQQDIMLGREALVEMLAAYRKIKPHRITVVFDGCNSPVFSPQRSRQKGISIRFSRSGESADDVIKRMAHKERENRNGCILRQPHWQSRGFPGLDPHHQKKRSVPQAAQKTAAQPHENKKALK